MTQSAGRALAKTNSAFGRSLARHLNAELIRAVNEAAFAHYDHRGLKGTTIVSGEIGISARAIGSGIAPILEEYALDKL